MEPVAITATPLVLYVACLRFNAATGWQATGSELWESAVSMVGVYVPLKSVRVLRPAQACNLHSFPPPPFISEHLVLWTRNADDVPAGGRM